MARRPWTSVEEHFASRHRPLGRNVDPNARNRIEREPKFETGNSRNRVHNSNENQDAEDRYDAGYLNDCKGWVRGAPTGKAPSGNNETAEDYPQGNFDKGQSYRRADKGNDWHSGSDKVEFRKAGDENEWTARSKKS
jgi:hypothetical protein